MVNKFSQKKKQDHAGKFDVCIRRLSMSEGSSGSVQELASESAQRLLCVFRDCDPMVSEDLSDDERCGCFSVSAHISAASPSIGVVNNADNMKNKNATLLKKSITIRVQ